MMPMSAYGPARLTKTLMVYADRSARISDSTPFHCTSATKALCVKPGRSGMGVGAVRQLAMQRRHFEALRISLNILMRATILGPRYH